MGTLKVLIADEDDASRAVLAGALQDREDVELVQEAKGGLEAITYTHYLAPHIALIDMHLSGLGGIEVAKYIKRFYPETRVVFVINHDVEARRVECENIGADALISADNIRKDLPRVLDRIKGSSLQ